MRFTILLGLILCICSINELNASTIEKDSLNPLYSDLVNAYQLKIQNLKVIRSLGKNVKLKYDVVNTGKHIVKLGRGKAIPNAMSIVFDDEIESSQMASYKAQIAEQILKQDLFIQSGKSATSREVKVNLNAPAKLAHLIGTDNGSRLAENVVDDIKYGSGSLGNHRGIDDMDMDMDKNMDMDVDSEVAMVDDYEMESEAPQFSEYTQKVTDIEMPKPSAKAAKKIKRPSFKKPKKELTESSADEMDFDEEMIEDINTPQLTESSEDFEEDFEEDIDADFGETETMTETVVMDNPRSRGKTVVNKTKSYTEVASDDGTETHEIKRSTKRISGIQEYPEDDSILATMKKKRKAKREAAKKEAMAMKTDAAGSEAYDDMNLDMEARALTKEELDTSADLETEKGKWYEGFKPYGLSKDDEEIAAEAGNDDGDDFLDRTTCPDLTMDNINVIKTGKKWVTVELQISNVGKGPAMIYGKTPKEGDNVYIKAHLSGSKKVSRGAYTIGGMFINKGVSNKAGKLMPGDSMTTQMKIDIRKKTKFTSVLILDLDAFGNCRECDETNNKQHVVLK